MIYFLLSLDELEPLEIFAIMIAFFVAMCIAMSFHEFAHAFTAHKCGDDTPKLTGRLTLNPFAHFSATGLLMFFLVGFGWAKPVQINPMKFRNYKRDMFLVSISGVLTNLVLAFIFSGLYVLFFTIFDSYSTTLLFLFFKFVLYFSITINIMLFLFNLLPIPPLDGFNALNIFVKYGNKFVEFMEKYGMFILFLLIIPIFNGVSLFGLIYEHIVFAIINLFFGFWGLFV